MEMLIDTGKKQDIDYIELQATKDGISVYRKCGFLEVDNIYTSMKYKY